MQSHPHKYNYHNSATIGGVMDTKNKSDYTVLHTLIDFLRYGQADGPSYIPSTLEYQLGGAVDTPNRVATIVKFVDSFDKLSFGIDNDEIGFLLSDVQRYLETMAPIDSYFGLMPGEDSTVLGYWSVR